MPRLSERLRREFEGVLNSRIISLAACREGEANAEEIKTVDQLIHSVPMRSSWRVFRINLIPNRRTTRMTGAL